MTKRIVLFLALAAGIWAGGLWIETAHRPRVTTQRTLAAVNGGAAEASRARQSESERLILSWTTIALTIGAFAIVFGTYRRKPRLTIIRNAAAASLLVPAFVLFSGCSKYDSPEFQEIQTSETGFVVPLEDETAQQVKFESEAYLDALKVGVKRVQIPHRWVQTGRAYYTGDWIPTVRLIKVNRSPVTRLWTADAESGTSKHDEAIWVESADSVGFSTGFNCTAFIAEPDAAKFLYWYPSGSLADVMDTEIRARIQQGAAEVAAKYPLDELRTRKQEMIETVREDVTRFFHLRGISITTVGMFGGFTYENPKIQESIDSVFIAQQLKNVSLAKYDAQQKTNDTLTMAATGEAAAKITIAEADAKVATIIAQSPAMLQLKMLDVEKARIEKWNGQYPVYFMGGGDKGANPTFMLQMPSVDGQQAQALH